MNNNILSKRSVLLMATMLSAMMLAASSMPSLVLTRAFAQGDVFEDDEVGQSNPNSAKQEDIPDVDALLTQLAGGSTSEEGRSDGEVEDNRLTQLAGGSTSEEGRSDGEVEDNRITVDPIAQTKVETGVNVNVDTHVIMDEENCEDANDEVNQANVQSADQEGRSDGEVGDNSFYVSPKFQTSEQVAYNVNVDTDVILADGCGMPTDELNQANVQSADQEAGSDIKTGDEGSMIIIPTNQRSDQISRNIGIDNDIIQPVDLPL
jgi:hypothetical protein